MQDAGKIFIGIVIFLALVSIPIWVTQARGEADTVPDPQVNMDVVAEFMAENYPDIDYDNECIESTDYMRLNHMKLLMGWRQWSVRDDTHGDPHVSYYTAEDGQEWFMSFTETCLGCHNDRAAFCTQCHEYTATQTGCWECHFEPGGY